MMHDDSDIGHGWKWLDAGLRSRRGGTRWTLGVWQPPMARLELCYSGYHHSPDPHCALLALPPVDTKAEHTVDHLLIARTEARGAALQSTSLYVARKSVHAEMRLLAAWYWRREDALAFRSFSYDLLARTDLIAAGGTAWWGAHDSPAHSMFNTWLTKRIATLEPLQAELSAKSE